MRKMKFGGDFLVWEKHFHMQYIIDSSGGLLYSDLSNILNQSSSGEMLMTVCLYRTL